MGSMIAWHSMEVVVVVVVVTMPLAVVIWVLAVVVLAVAVTDVVEEAKDVVAGPATRRNFIYSMEETKCRLLVYLRNLPVRPASFRPLLLRI